MNIDSRDSTFKTSFLNSPFMISDDPNLLRFAGFNFSGSHFLNFISSVGIATGYELDSPSLIPGIARFFSSPPRSDRHTLGPTQPLNQWVQSGDFPGCKEAWA
jgi:hypothetical protein